MATKKTTTKTTAPTGGLKVTTDASGRITGASDSAGSYSVDSSGKATKISSSGAPKTATPAVAQGSITAPKTLEDAVVQGRSLLGEQPAAKYSIPAMIEEEKKALQARKTAANIGFDQQAGDIRAVNNQEQGGARADTARFRGEGFSTAATAYIDSVQKKGEKRLSDLESARQAALANLDAQSADRIMTLQLKEQDRLDKLSELRFNQMLSLVNVGLSMQANDRAERSLNLQQEGFDYQKARDLKLDMKEARLFAVENDIKGPGYELGGTWYSSTTGEAFPDKESAAAAGLNDNNVVHFDPNAKETKAYLQQLSLKYADAGINWQTDTIDSASAKIKSGSAIYREQVRPPSSGSGSSGTSYKDLKAERDYIKSTIPSGIQQLKSEGKSWGEVADMVVKQGFDPGEFDDVFHRAYDTPQQYDAWRTSQANIKKGGTSGGGQITIDPDTGNLIIN